MTSPGHLTDELAEVSRSAAAVAAACEGLDARAVLALFAQAGLLGAGAPGSCGGLDLPLEFDAAIIDAIAPKLLDDPVLDAMLAARYCPDVDVARALVDGRVLVASSFDGALTATAAGADVIVTGTARDVAHGVSADFLLAPVDLDGRELLAVIDLGDKVTRRPVLDGLDPERRAAHIVVKGQTLPPHRVADAAADWRGDGLLLSARWLLAHASLCLGMTADFVSSRQQFGQPLSVFQSVRFALASAAEELRSLDLLASPAGPRADRCAAYCYAAQIVPPVIERCMHLHGGMGYTEEVPLHAHLRRARARILAISTEPAFAEIVDAMIAH